MRTTVDIPDDLFRQAKAEAALRGRKLKDLVVEGLRRVVESPAPRRARPSLSKLMARSRGIVDSGIPDLATNPKHMEGFGRGAQGHR